MSRCTVYTWGEKRKDLFLYPICFSHIKKSKTNKTCSVAPFALARLRMVPRTEQVITTWSIWEKTGSKGTTRGRFFLFPSCANSYLCSGEPQCRVQVLLGVEQSRGAFCVWGADAGVQRAFGDGNICWDSRFSLCVCLFKYKETNH